MTWDAKDGASYSVTLWTGDADSASANAVGVATSGTLDTNRWRLPSNLTQGTTYFWQVTTSAEGKTSLSPVWGFEMDGRVTVELIPGWNLISIPFQLERHSAMQLLGRKLFTMENRNYVSAMSLDSGKGYWLFQKNDKNGLLDLIPADSTRSQNVLELDDGWNMVGPTDDTYIRNDALTIWQFIDGTWQYLPPDEKGGYNLDTGHGYWIYQDSLESTQGK